jgi:adenylate cyclase
VTESVVGAIEPSLRQAEMDRARAKPTANLDAYDCYLRGVYCRYQLTRESLEQGCEYLRLAIESDPHYALAKAALALNYVINHGQGWGKPNDRAHALELAQDAANLEPGDPATLRCAGLALAFFGLHDRGLAILEKAASLNANGSQVLSSLGMAKIFACIEPDQAIAHFQRAMRLSPRDPEMKMMLNGIGLAHLISGRNEEALIFAQACVDESPQLMSGHRVKIVALANLGRLQEAKAAADVLLAYDPTYTTSARAAIYRDEDFRRRYYDGLKAAGLPE